MRTLMLLAFFVGIHFVACAQDVNSSKKWTDDDHKHRVNLYPHLGSVMLPEGFGGAVTNNWMDAWGGYLKSRTNDFEIVWTAGLIEHPFEKQKVIFAWSEPEQVGDVSLTLGEGKTKDEDILVAKVGRYPIHFGANIRNAEDREMFLKIIRSYTSERCPVCKSLPFVGELRSSDE